MEDNVNKIFAANMSINEFSKLSDFIYTNYGIKMPPVKKIMLQSRLQKRLRALNMTSYGEYIDYLFSKKGMQEELFQMIDVVSTNKTDFFREPAHFDFLRNTLLPMFMSQNRGRSFLKVWSAACSSGEEPYSIGIALSEFALKNSAFDFSVFATDISTRMLERAMNAIYTEDRVQMFPFDLKKRYLLRSKNKENKTVRIIPAIRKRVTFKRLNLMDTNYDVPGTYDIVFCRNVLIYFDRETQEKVISKLCTKLKTDGHFILGHSESIMNMNLPLKQVKPTVFRKI